MTHSFVSFLFCLFLYRLEEIGGRGGEGVEFGLVEMCVTLDSHPPEGNSLN